MMYSGDEIYSDEITSGGLTLDDPLQGGCFNCGGHNLVQREDRDDSTGYHDLIVFCLDCNGRAD